MCVLHIKPNGETHQLSVSASEYAKETLSACYFSSSFSIL